MFGELYNVVWIIRQYDSINRCCVKITASPFFFFFSCMHWSKFETGRAVVGEPVLWNIASLHFLETMWFTLREKWEKCNAHLQREKKPRLGIQNTRKRDTKQHVLQVEWMWKCKTEIAKQPWLIIATLLLNKLINNTIMQQLEETLAFAPTLCCLLHKCEFGIDSHVWMKCQMSNSGCSYVSLAAVEKTTRIHTK